MPRITNKIAICKYEFSPTGEFMKLYGDIKRSVGNTLQDLVRDMNYGSLDYLKHFQMKGKDNDKNIFYGYGGRINNNKANIYLMEPQPQVCQVQMDDGTNRTDLLTLNECLLERRQKFEDIFKFGYDINDNSHIQKANSLNALHRILNIEAQRNYPQEGRKRQARKRWEHGKGGIETFGKVKELDFLNGFDAILFTDKGGNMFFNDFWGKYPITPNETFTTPQVPATQEFDVVFRELTNNPQARILITKQQGEDVPLKAMPPEEIGKTR